MREFDLRLYSRKGCCLCEGLESRLREIPLLDLEPPLELYVIDIDVLDRSSTLRLRYDLEVPVMVIWSNTSKKVILELPRVSPRLNGEGLMLWLQKSLSNSFISD